MNIEQEQSPQRKNEEVPSTRQQQSEVPKQDPPRQQELKVRTQFAEDIPDPAGLPSIPTSSLEEKE